MYIWHKLYTSVLSHYNISDRQEQKKLTSFTITKTSYHLPLTRQFTVLGCFSFDKFEISWNPNRTKLARNTLKTKLIMKQHIYLGLGLPRTTFWPYLRHLYPSSSISTSLKVWTTTRGSRMGLTTGDISMLPTSVLLEYMHLKIYRVLPSK